MSDDEQDGPINFEQVRPAALKSMAQRRRNEGQLNKHNPVIGGDGAQEGRDNAPEKPGNGPVGPRLFNDVDLPKDTLSFSALRADAQHKVERKRMHKPRPERGLRLHQDIPDERGPAVLESGLVTGEDRKRKDYVEQVVSTLQPTQHWGDLIVEAVRVDKLHPKDAIKKAAGLMHDLMSDPQEFTPDRLAKGVSLMLRRLQEQARLDRKDDPSPRRS